MFSQDPTSVGFLIRDAIVRESTAVKLGNVHPNASFSDLKHSQFLSAAEAIGAAFDRAVDRRQGVGETIFACSQAMMDRVQTNTSLGTILLLVPLGFAWLQTDKNTNDSLTCIANLKKSIGHVLMTLIDTDSAAIYEAIRVAKPGGLGQVPDMDVSRAAPPRILAAMAAASKWDDVALQYVSDFQLVFDYAKLFRELPQQGRGHNDDEAIRNLQVCILADRVDSLIVRKKGFAFAESVCAEAKLVREIGLEHGEQSAAFAMAWQRLDDFLRDDRHQGNPGTTADLIAAVCFVASLVRCP